MQDAVRLAELLCARLCHDLSGPAGSLTAAAELAFQEAGAGSEAASLAAESAEALRRRLRLLRAAWAADPAALDAAEFRELLAGFPGGRGIAMDLHGLDIVGRLTPEQGRAVLNVLLLGLEALGGAGHMAVTAPAPGELMVTIRGPRSGWPAGLAAMLTDVAAAWPALTDPRAVQTPLTIILARRAGVRLSISSPADGASDPPPLHLAIVGNG